jgi:hypothetical protein
MADKEQTLTTVLQAQQDGRPDGDFAVPARRGRRDLFGFLRGPAWPIAALLALWPLWWLLGLADYLVIFMSVPMVRNMYRWRRTRERRIKAPPGFGIWVMFLLVCLVSVSTVSLMAPDTLGGPASHRVISWALRMGGYVGCTIMLLYAGSLTEEELPRRKLAWLLGLVGIYCVIGGIAGIAEPSLTLTSPLSVLVPASFGQTNGTLIQMMHPGLAQVQGFLGYAEARPKAPFDFTNNWGNALAITMPWLVVAWWNYGTRRTRTALMAVVAVGLVPVLYSLDRGLWVGLGCMLLYFAIRYAARGKLALIGGIVGVLAIAVFVVSFTPAASLFSQRLSHGKSNQGRLSLSVIATKDALASPVLGFGDTRHQIGSGQSIAIGRTANCPKCGNQTIGGNGQLWLLFITTGFLGAFFYVAFFAYSVWRYRRDSTPYGMVGVMILLVSFVFMLVYDADNPTLYFMMLCVAMLWKNDMVMRREGTFPSGRTKPQVLADTGPHSFTAGA